MKTKLIIVILLALFQTSYSQVFQTGNISGSFQLDMQTYQQDSIISAPDVSEDVLLNTYLNLLYTRGNFAAGIRYEAYLNALQGYDKRYNGQGFPYKFLSYKNNELEVTVGNFYDQFGNGLIFRSYEDKNLGYDNAMEGVKVKYEVYRGFWVKGVFGKQRLYFDKGPGIVRGFDSELDVRQLFGKSDVEGINLLIGGSFVSKYQEDKDPIYKLPENVAAYAGRFNLIAGNFNLSGEYAYKINDPSADNQYIYKNGEALLLTTSWSSKGFGIVLNALRLDNMSFRSDRNANLMNLNINYLPAISKTQTYSLAAMYPFATQPQGEMGFQSELSFRLKKGTWFGGKYGTNFSLNYSRIHSIEKTQLFEGEGYKSDFFAIGDEVFFEEANVEIQRKINQSVKFTLTYINQTYNKDILQGMNGYGKIYSHIGVAEVTWRITNKHAVRFETQGLFTKQDYGDWAMGLIEYSISPNWFFTIYDLYNYGNDDKSHQIHYYNAAIGFSKGSNRFQIGYGKQREGIICVGGVCRNVPAANGFMISITSTF